MLGEAFPVSDGHRYVYQVHRLLENTSTSAPFRPFLQYLQNYSSCYVKLAFMLKKKRNLQKIYTKYYEALSRNMCKVMEINFTFF